MINWSTKQRCFYNGSSCVNINYSNYQNFDKFIDLPKIMNEYACLGIEATIIPDKNKLKYFTYNSETYICSSGEPVDIETCE